MPGPAGSALLQAGDRQEWLAGRFVAVGALQVGATPGTAGWQLTEMKDDASALLPFDLS